MMAKTTIALTDETKELLDDHKQGQESYDDVVRRLAGQGSGQMWTEQEIREIAEQVLQEQTKNLRR